MGLCKKGNFNLIEHETHAVQREETSVGFPRFYYRDSETVLRYLLTLILYEPVPPELL